MPEPIETICPEPCGVKFKAEMPAIDATNTRNYSTAIAVHEKPIQCPACNRFLVPVFGAVQVVWALRPIAAETSQEPSRIILAPSAANRNGGD